MIMTLRSEDKSISWAKARLISAVHKLIQI